MYDLPCLTGFYNMQKIRHTFSALLVFILFLMVPSRSLVFAASPTPCPAGQTATDLGCIHTAEPMLFVSDIYAIGLWLIGFVAIIFIIVGSYFIMTSRGNVEMLARGKSFIFYSIAGLLLAIFGFVFIEIITGQILKIPGFGS